MADTIMTSGRSKVDGILFEADGAEKQLEVKAGETVKIERVSVSAPHFQTPTPSTSPSAFRFPTGSGALGRMQRTQRRGKPRKAARQAKPGDLCDVGHPHHMCQSSQWEHAKRCAEAYFPPTLEADGNMTHATAGRAAAD